MPSVLAPLIQTPRGACGAELRGFPRHVREHKGAVPLWRGGNDRRVFRVSQPTHSPRLGAGLGPALKTTLV